MRRIVRYHDVHRGGHTAHSNAQYRDSEAQNVRDTLSNRCGVSVKIPPSPLPGEEYRRCGPAIGPSCRQLLNQQTSQPSGAVPWEASPATARRRSQCTCFMRRTGRRTLTGFCVRRPLARRSFLPVRTRRMTTHKMREKWAGTNLESRPDGHLTAFGAASGFVRIRPSRRATRPWTARWRSRSLGRGQKVGRHEFESWLRPPEGRRIPSYPTGPHSNKSRWIF